MKVMNYMNLNRHPVQLSFYKDRTHEFKEIYHAHQGMEFLYVHEGHGHVVVDRQIFELKPGSFFYFRPFQLHRVRISGLPRQAYVRSLFVFEPSAVEEVLAAFPGLQAFIRTLWKDPATSKSLSGLVLPSMDEFLQSHSRTLQQCPPEQQLEGQLFFLCSLLYHIRSHWLSGNDSERLPHAGTLTAAEHIMDWLEEHYTEPFELNKLAQAVHLTPNHVSGLFRKSVGGSITEYITARRIRQACWLLRTTDRSVKEIGENVGYPNFSHFCKTFKRNVGLSPYQYKKSF